MGIRRRRSQVVINVCNWEKSRDKRFVIEIKADVQVSHDGTSAPQVDMNPHVIIFCPECDASQSLEMNLFWKRGNKAIGL